MKLLFEYIDVNPYVSCVFIGVLVTIWIVIEIIQHKRR